MKTRIPIKKYVVDEETRMSIEVMAQAKDPVALEYRKLELHHEQETRFLIKTIEALEKRVEELEQRVSDPSEGN